MAPSAPVRKAASQQPVPITASTGLVSKKPHGALSALVCRYHGATI